LISRKLYPIKRTARPRRSDRNFRSIGDSKSRRA
jgi:hypothetical protein